MVPPRLTRRHAPDGIASQDAGVSGRHARILFLALAALLITVLVLSCTALPAASPSNTPTDTALPAPTSTMTATAQPTATNSPTKTVTAQPTATNSPTKTATAQPTATNSPTTIASLPPTGVRPVATTPTTIPVYSYEVVNTYPHDRRAFTQGLVYEAGLLYEGTGLYGRSTLRRVELETGDVLQSHQLLPQYFGEGITIFGDRIYQLTWQSQVGFIFDKETFEQLAEFAYPTEGWGLTHDGQQLIMSDGTSTLHFLDPETLTEAGQIQVRANGIPVVRLNELEYINGEVYANIWQTDRVARIDPQTGDVVGWIELGGLLEPEDHDPSVDVLNGIAYDAAGGRLFVTGKLWPKLFEIELLAQKTYFPVVGNGHKEPAQITILHTNDFHGNLEADSGGRGGSAYMAGVINNIRDEVGGENVILLDAGDVYLGAKPISQLLEGESTIDIYNMLGYDVAAYGNHEFDLGQSVLISRTAQSDFPWIGSNIVITGTDWETPAWSPPYITMTVGAPGNPVTLGIIGLDTDETPLITRKDSTEGLVFKDLTETALHYYDEVMAQSDALIVLAHMGTEDSWQSKGLRTVAQELIDAGKPVDLMIAGHQHVPLFWPVRVGETAIVEAGFHGRWLGRIDVTVDPATKKLSIDTYQLITINDQLPADPDVAARVAYWADKVGANLDQIVGTTDVSLIRDYNDESNMGNMVTDGMLWKADEYDDGTVNGSVEIAFTNPGGLRDDIVIPVGATLPYTITWGDTFDVMPFGNTLYLMDLTGAQIQTLLDQSASLFKGILQTSGATWSWRNDCRCDSPATWGAFDVTVDGEPLDPARTYRVVTNDFLAGGQDGWVTFAEGTNRLDTYYDMQEGINEYIQWYNATVGPIDHTVEGRIVYVP